MSSEYTTLLSRRPSLPTPPKTILECLAELSKDYPADRTVGEMRCHAETLSDEDYDRFVSERVNREQWEKRASEELFSLLENVDNQRLAEIIAKLGNPALFRALISDVESTPDTSHNDPLLAFLQ
jgi:hypothetical protein